MRFVEGSAQKHCLPLSRIPTPLEQPGLHYLSEGLMGPVDCRKALEQLEPLVRRVEVEQREDDGRQIRPPAILRER